MNTTLPEFMPLNEFARNQHTGLLGLIESEYGWLIVIGILLFIIIVAAILISLTSSKSNTDDYRICNNCGGKFSKGTMAITMGENGGLCRPCLDEILKIPGVLKEKSE